MNNFTLSFLALFFDRLVWPVFYCFLGLALLMFFLSIFSLLDNN